MPSSESAPRSQLVRWIISPPPPPPPPPPPTTVSPSPSRTCSDSQNYFHSSSYISLFVAYISYSALCIPRHTSSKLPDSSACQNLAIAGPSICRKLFSSHRWPAVSIPLKKKRAKGLGVWVFKCVGLCVCVCICLCVCLTAKEVCLCVCVCVCVCVCDICWCVKVYSTFYRLHSGSDTLSCYRSILLKYFFTPREERWPHKLINSGQKKSLQSRADEKEGSRGFSVMFHKKKFSLFCKEILIWERLFYKALSRSRFILSF